MTGRGGAWKALVLAFCCAALAGCGDDEDSSDPTGPGEPTAPIPVFSGEPLISPGYLAVRQGDSFTLRFAVQNRGLDSPGAFIAVVFPQLTDSSDADRIVVNAGGDRPGVSVIPADSLALDAACAMVPAPCFIAQYADEFWARNETNVVTITVRPRELGNFSFYLRAHFSDGLGACSYVTTLPPNGTEEVDPLGWNARRFDITVTEDAREARIEPGTFLMGSPDSEYGRPASPDSERPHEVTLTQPFMMLAHEVTQEEWERVMGWNESFNRGPANPVDGITWYDAIDFCNRLSTVAGLDSAYSMVVALADSSGVAHIRRATVTWDPLANGYRLPTEAEWEYSCRAGTTTAFYTGQLTRLGCSPVDPALDQAGWYCGNSGGQSLARTQPVARKPANAFGLHDTHGNVSEWCWDRFIDTYHELDPVDPTPADTIPDLGDFRVIRGGAWDSYSSRCRSAHRAMGVPGAVSASIGLRVARSVF